MATINSRIPFYITNESTGFGNLKVELYLYSASVGTPPTSPQYTVRKDLYQGNTETLSVDISEFVSDFFSFTAPTLPSDNLALDSGVHYKVDVVINGNAATTYDAFYGYSTTEPIASDKVLAVKTTKNLVEGSNQFLTADLTGMNVLRWETDGGDIVSKTITGSDYSKIRVLNPLLSLANSKYVRVEAEKTGGGTPNFSRLYRLTCAFDKLYTVKFINRYGVWETIDMTGSRKDSLAVKGETFRRLDTGNNQAYNKNGTGSFSLNTGWVEESFKGVVQDLMLSESIYVSDGTEDVPVILKTNAQELFSQRKDKVINYSFNFNEAGYKISLV
jgi:hypothetical protein